MLRSSLIIPKRTAARTTPFLSLPSPIKSPYSNSWRFLTITNTRVGSALSPLQYGLNGRSTYGPLYPITSMQKYSRIRHQQRRDYIFIEIKEWLSKFFMRGKIKDHPRDQKIMIRLRNSREQVFSRLEKALQHRLAISRGSMKRLRQNQARLALARSQTRDRYNKTKKEWKDWVLKRGRMGKRIKLRKRMKTYYKTQRKRIRSSTHRLLQNVSNSQHFFRHWIRLHSGYRLDFRRMASRNKFPPRDAKIRDVLYSRLSQYKFRDLMHLRTAYRSTLQNLLYSRHTVTLPEPAEPFWFSANGGFPLTSRDSRTGRFVNPWLSVSTNGLKRLAEVWRWRKTRMMGLREEDDEKLGEKKTPPNWLSRLKSPPRISEISPPSTMDKMKLTWVGHATTLLQVPCRQHGVFTVLTDPIFSHKCSPFQFFRDSEFLGVPRRQPPSISLKDFPDGGVDVCVISHDHYDHLDHGTIESLVEKDLVRYWVVPLGIKRWLIDSISGIDGETILELEWWDSVTFIPNKTEKSGSGKETSSRFLWDETIIKTLVETPQSFKRKEGNKDGNELVITCAPSQHWCSRSPFDRNTRLWCSYAIHSNLHSTSSKSNSLSFYFAGDTGYPKNFPLHRQIGDRLGPFDLAALPIGAYKPRFFNQDSHCDPYEALKIHADIKSIRSVPIHWGTFPLTNESTFEPPLLLHDAVQRSTRNVNYDNIQYHGLNESSSKAKESGHIDFNPIPHGESVESN